MLDDHTFGIKEPPPPRGLAAWYQRDRPAILAAAWLWIFFLILAGITLFTGWASLPVTLTLHLLLSLGAGFLAAWLHQREQPTQPHYVRVGTLAGFYLPTTSAVVILVIALAAGIGSLGTMVPLMIPYFAFLPVEMGACSALGALGAWIYRLLSK